MQGGLCRGGLSPTFGSTHARDGCSRSQQQVIATGKSHRARSMLPSVSLYCLGVWHRTWPTLPDCLAGYSISTKIPE